MIDTESRTSLSPEAVDWLANGKRGISSNTIFTHLTGIDAMGGWGGRSHPHDPADLWRCRLLLEQVPEFGERLCEMKTASPVWARLVAKWGELCALMDREAPNWRNGEGFAPDTYHAMRLLIEGKNADALLTAPEN
jgi:hypothetical protein